MSKPRIVFALYAVCLTIALLLALVAVIFKVVNNRLPIPYHIGVFVFAGIATILRLYAKRRSLPSQRSILDSRG